MRSCNSHLPEEHFVCYQTSQCNWVIIKVLYRCFRRYMLGWHNSRLGFVTPIVGEVSLGPLGNTHHLSLASIVTNELVIRWCVTERVKRLAGNEIELGIGYRRSNLGQVTYLWQREQRMLLCGLTDKDLRRICRSQYEHLGSAIGYWPRIVPGHVYIVLEPVGSARLTLRWQFHYEFISFDVPKFVRSSGCDHGHDEESRNGRDIKIDILEAYVWISELFREKSGFFRSTEGLPEPPGG